VNRPSSRAGSDRWVLVTDGGHGASRDCVAAVRALHTAGFRAAVTVSRRTPLARPSRYAERWIDVPGVLQPGYRGAIQAEVERHPYVTVLPASEPAFLALTVPTPELVDKAVLYEAARRAGLAVPPWRSCGSPEEIRAAAMEFGYPVVVKPVVRHSAAAFVSDPARLEGAVFAAGPTIVQKYLSDGLRAISGVLRGGRPAAVVHERWLRIWPRRCGLASAAVTTAPDLETEARLLDLLRGYEGIFVAQLAGAHLIDLNLRVGSTHALAVAAGTNLVGIHCDLASGAHAPERPLRSREGVRFRWLEGDLRSLSSAVLAGDEGPVSAGRDFLGLRPSAHGTESLSDPGPMLSRALLAAARAPARLGSRIRGDG
jgi:hypothetical protein